MGCKPFHSIPVITITSEPTQPHLFATTNAKGAPVEHSDQVTQGGDVHHPLTLVPLSIPSSSSTYVIQEQTHMIDDTTSTYVEDLDAGHRFRYLGWRYDISEIQRPGTVNPQDDSLLNDAVAMGFRRNVAQECIDRYRPDNIEQLVSLLVERNGRNNNNNIHNHGNHLSSEAVASVHRTLPTESEIQQLINRTMMQHALERQPSIADLLAGSLSSSSSLASSMEEPLYIPSFVPETFPSSPSDSNSDINFTSSNTMNPIHQQNESTDQHETNRASGDYGGDLCVVCFEANKEVAFVPCGHLCVCLRCGKKMDLCPICRAPTQYILKVYRV
jgi:hypothetical protein